MESEILRLSVRTSFLQLFLNRKKQLQSFPFIVNWSVQQNAFTINVLIEKVCLSKKMINLRYFELF
jgi:hypothetical protein